MPPPVPNTSLGPGDLFEVQIVGEKDLPKEYRVQPDGSVDFPYLDRIRVAGLEPQEVVDLIRKKLSEREILRDPQVSLVVKQYGSKTVSVLGQVQKQSTVAWTPGMKLIDAITTAGGFNSMADTKHVKLTRQVGKGKTQTVEINVDAIADGQFSDVLLQAGDAIKVDARVF